jgi:hypothetical protein
VPGWRRSAGRTGLKPNSLQTGNFTGKITISGRKARIIEPKPLCRTDFSVNSLSKSSGSFSEEQGFSSG